MSLSQVRLLKQKISTLEDGASSLTRNQQGGLSSAPSETSL